MRRRRLLGGAGVTLSGTLAGCGDLIEPLEEDSDDGSEQGNESPETDGENGSETNGSDADPSDGAETDEPENETADEIHEDDSIDGEVVLSDAAREVVAAQRHTYTWVGEPPADQCSVHLELETIGDEDAPLDMDARIYDDDGAEIASTQYAEEPSPKPGDTATYSFRLTTCEETAAYALGIDSEAEADEETDEPATLLIDDFEAYASDALAGPWTLDGTGDAEVTASAALHAESTQGLDQTGDSNVRSFPGQGLPNYPEDGREVSVLMRPDSNTSQPWILVGMEEDVWSTTTPGWRLIIDPNGGIRIARETGTGAEILDEDATLPGLTDETVDCRFVADSTDGVEFWLQDLEGATLGSVSTDETNGIDDEMSIGFRSSQSVEWDWPRLVEE